jgi:hypothetical protein
MPGITSFYVLWICSHAYAIASNTRIKIDVCIDYTRPALAFEIEPITKSFTDIKAKGIRLRVLTEITADNISSCKQLSTLVDGLRHLDGIKGSFYINEAEYLAPEIFRLLRIAILEPCSHCLCATAVRTALNIKAKCILKQAIDKYKSKLETDDNLQCDFIAAWRSQHEPYNYTSDPLILTEVRYLLEKLRHSNRLNLFV